MKKILFIEANRDGTIGGSYYSLLYLIQGLDKTKYQPHILFCQDNCLISEYQKITPFVYINNFGPSSSSPASGIIDIIKFPYRFFVKIILKQFRLRSILSKIKPDIIHLNNGYDSLHEWMVAAYLHKIKIVAHDRGTRFPSSFQTIILARLLDAIICVSDSYKNNVLSQNIKVRSVCRIYNGLDVDTFISSSNTKDRAMVCEELNIGGGSQHIVGIVGNIIRWKGQHVVLKAISRVKEHFPHIKCLIVGEVALRSENYMKELEAYVRDQKMESNIVFTGFRKDVPAVLSYMDILIHSSIEPEPFGRVLLEGMAMSKPIIATNAGGPTEIIADGETGILVPMNDHDKMADAILYLLKNEDLRKSMGNKGRKRLIETFNIRRMVDETEKLYDNLFEE